MSTAGVEAVLARLYTDAAFRARFLASPGRACVGLDLTDGELAQLAAIDRDGLELACASLARKRAAQPPARRAWPWR